MKPGKKIATWYNDGTPHGRFEFEPGCEPDYWAGLAAKLLMWWVVGGAIAAMVLLRVEAARGADVPAYVVTNRMPAYTVVNKVPAASPGVVSGPTVSPDGYYELRRHWDGYQWHQQWVPRGGQPVAAAGKSEPGPPTSGFITVGTRGTTAPTPTATPWSTATPASTGAAYTTTPAKFVARLGGTVVNCASPFG